MVYGDLFTKPKEVDKKVVEVEKKGPPAADAQALMVALLSVYEPEKRIALLDEGLEYWPDDEALLLLKDFFNIRYKKVNTRIVYADLFLGLMIENLTLASMAGSVRNEKETTKYFEKSPFINWQKSTTKPELRRELFFGECMQMLAYYTFTCRNDRQYASSFMGLVKAKPEKVENKLQDDLNALQDALEQAENSAKFGSRWTSEMKIFHKALELYINNL